MTNQRFEAAIPAQTRDRWSNSQRFVPRRIVRPVRRFMELSTSSAIIMLAAAVLALLWVNSPVGSAYEALWTTKVEFKIGRFDAISGLTLREWVTEGAMTFFFFVVAMEIKREIVSGELREWRAASLPVIAALGGMIVPGLIYFAST